MVKTAVDRFLETLELDELGKARAEIARALAINLDSSTQDDRASVIMAVSSISKELRETLAQLSDGDSEAVDWAQSLFIKTE